MAIDPSTLDKRQLQTLLANAQRRGATDMITAVLQEMHRRGIASRREYAALSWNQDRIDTALAPFARVATTVRNNERTTYTRAGGHHIGLPKDHPEHMWIESYAGIKISKVVNSVFSGEIKRPGDDPLFALYFNEGSETRHEPKVTRTFEPNQLSEALLEWEGIAQLASASRAEV
jgi:hypothetical protein